MSQAEKRQYAIVLVGRIPPSQLTVRWLEKSGLIDSADADDAQIMTQVRDLSIFKVSGIDYLADGNRVQLATTEGGEVLPMFDQVEGILMKAAGVQINAVGINTSAHYDVKTWEEWMRIGDKMAPKEPWKPIISGRPGLLSVRIRGSRSDGRKGFRNIVVEPSKTMQFGVFIHVNEHVEIDNSSSSEEGVKQTLDLLRDYKLRVIKDSTEIEEYILS